MAIQPTRSLPPQWHCRTTNSNYPQSIEWNYRPKFEKSDRGRIFDNMQNGRVYCELSPLTKSPSNDGLPPLRPIDLMVGSLEPLQDPMYPSLSSPGDSLRRGHRLTLRIIELWWDKWLKLYLHHLQERQK